jgi:hypothetical protein
VSGAISNRGLPASRRHWQGAWAEHEVLHDETKGITYRACAGRGWGNTRGLSEAYPYVDGTSDRVQASLITLLNQIVENGLKEYDEGF